MLALSLGQMFQDRLFNFVGNLYSMGAEHFQDGILDIREGLLRVALSRGKAFEFFGQSPGYLFPVDLDMLMFQARTPFQVTAPVKAADYRR
jgi:hypothetical protein